MGVGKYYAAEAYRARISSERNKRIKYTSFLVFNKIRDPLIIAKYFGVSENTAKQYIRESKNTRFAGMEVLQKILDEEADTPFEAINKYEANDYEGAPNVNCCIIFTLFAYLSYAQITELRSCKDKLRQNKIGSILVIMYYKVSNLIVPFLKKMGYRIQMRDNSRKKHVTFDKICQST